VTSRSRSIQSGSESDPAQQIEQTDRLIAVLDAFIDVVEGSIDDSFRIRGIQTAMLLEQATASGAGISISEIARHTEAPLENVRRHTTFQLEFGHLRAEAGPDDDRINRLFVTESGSRLYDTAELVRRLGLLGDDDVDGSSDGTLPYDEIIAVLLAFIRCFPGAMRVQAIKRELLIHRATLAGKGITITELAQQTSTPLETVRRSVNEAAEQGAVRFEQDPDDERKALVFFSDPERESQRVADVSEHLSRVDWSRFRSGT
jgi:DNA-binding MarR family transcriptional regulator